MKEMNVKSVCDKDQCNGCGACVSICPKNCVKIEKTIYNYNAVIREEACIGCHLCRRVCPNIHMKYLHTPILWKQGWATARERNYSSSGGVASALTRMFISTGGYVAACMFQDGRFIFHITNDINMAIRFAGSKYVKSDPEGIYPEVLKLLDKNKVLFIGLPCQVAAMRNYAENHENLYTIDLICHGTPDLNVLEHFLTDKGIKINEIKDIQFREKTIFGIIVDGKRLAKKNTTDDYLYAFLKSLDYTKNCYSCRFASLERTGDITLGDSWGTSYIMEEKNGVSLILIQSEKGKELLENSDIELKDVDIQKALNNNMQLLHPSKNTKKRKYFLDLLHKGNGFRYALFVIAPVETVKRIMKSLLSKFLF